MAKIYAINRGTRYDITGNMRRLVRRMESGEFKPCDVLVITTERIQNNTIPEVTLHHFGTSTVGEIHWMLASAQGTIESQ